MCGLFWGAHKSLAPRARTLLGGLGQATLSFFAVATLLFVFFGECPIFCDLAKQRRKIVGGVSEVGKDDFSRYFCWRCVFFSLFYFSSAEREEIEKTNSPASDPGGTGAAGVRRAEHTWGARTEGVKGVGGWGSGDRAQGSGAIPCVQRNVPQA